MNISCMVEISLLMNESPPHAIGAWPLVFDVRKVPRKCTANRGESCSSQRPKLVVLECIIDGS